MLILCDSLSEWSICSRQLDSLSYFIVFTRTQWPFKSSVSKSWPFVLESWVLRRLEWWNTVVVPPVWGGLAGSWAYASHGGLLALEMYVGGGERQPRALSVNLCLCQTLCHLGLLVPSDWVPSYFLKEDLALEYFFYMAAHLEQTIKKIQDFSEACWTFDL